MDQSRGNIRMDALPRDYLTIFHMAINKQIWLNKKWIIIIRGKVDHYELDICCV